MQKLHEHNRILKRDMIKKKSKYLHKFTLLFYKKTGGKGVPAIFWTNETYARLPRLLILAVVQYEKHSKVPNEEIC